MSSKRIGILFGGIAVVFCTLLGRLFQLQIVNGDSLRPVGVLDERTVSLPAARGAIFDRDGRPLRVSRDAFDVHVTASAFREKNVVDALADLMALLMPPPGLLSPLERSRLVRDLRAGNPGPILLRILALDARSAVLDDADDLHGRASILIEPEGTLVRPSSYARRRVLDALAVLAGDQGPTQREMRKRLRAAANVSVEDITKTTAARLEARIRVEEELLGRLAAELRMLSASDLRVAIDELCDRHFRRVESEVERRIDDAICLQQFGSWNLDAAKLGDEELARLRVKAAAPIVDPARARTAVAAAQRILSGGLPGGAAGPEPDIRPGAPVDCEAARAAGLADFDRATVRAALCGQIRSDPAFDRSRYLDARKESQTRNELATFRSDELGCGGTFALTGIIEGPEGLRALGFDLVASFTRDDAREQPGANLELLLGDVTRRNIPTCGVEQKLDEVLKGEPGEARIGPDGNVAALRPPKHGESVTLTLSLPLQQRVERLLDRLGAIAVVDAQTGGILATATWPAPRDGEVRAALAELAELECRKDDLAARRRGGDEGAQALLEAVADQINQSPAFHRGVTCPGITSPGSVMKALTLLTGLEAGVITPSFEIDCRTPDHGIFGCHEHGRVDLELAIERSCNEYCYQTVGLLGGSGPLMAMYDKVGLFDEVVGLIGPAPGALNRRQILNDDPRNLAIGQGSFSLPPVRLAAVAASIATGRAVRAHLWAAEGKEAAGPPFAREENLAVIRSGMRRVAVGARGTAALHYRRVLEPLGIAGKTGTAQVKRQGEDLHSGWFVGYAPHSAPRYAFAVLMDRTREDGADCAPIAARVVEACYEVLGGRP